MKIKGTIYRIPFGKLVQNQEGDLVDRVPLPVFATEGAAAFDLYSANHEPIDIFPGEIKLIPLGIKVAVERGYKLTVKPRSGLALKNGITLTNSPGTIDSDYRGEVGAILQNCSDQTFTVLPLMRVCQGEIEEAKQYVFKEVESEELLGYTERGAGGFNSTGTGGIK